MAKSLLQNAPKAPKTSRQSNATAKTNAALKARRQQITAAVAPDDIGKKLSKAAKPNKTTYNDLDLDNWKDYEEVLTDSLWMMNSRDKSGGHQLDYHGNCIPQILTQLLTRFTREGEVVIDYFLGSGTTAIEAERLNRECIGIELSPRMVEYVQDKLNDLDASARHDVIRGNSQDGVFTGKKIEAALAKRDLEQAHFAFLHPPYDDIIQFSEHPDDLSNMAGTEAFIDGFKDVAQLAYDKLQRGRFAAVVIGDKYANKEWVPLGFYCMQAMNAAGFRTKSIIVKNMAGNERGKGKTGNLWRYRALKGGFYVFKHEYIFLFEKP